MVSNSWAIFLRRILLAVLVTALLTTVGCQTAPVQEMSDARQAIAVAKEAGAADHAAADLKAAEEYLISAERSLSNRLYSTARDHALKAKSRALDALKASEADQETNGG